MKQGFSLVELSIVLVILGLLVGGVLTGQNLIRAAELRSITTQYSSYQTASYSFRDRYLGLPGDIINANDFWPTSSNGDGDSRIEFFAGASTAGEMFGFWQQLALAGMIEGSFTGVSGAGSGIDAIVGQNVPQGKIGTSGWTAIFVGNVVTTNSDFFAGNYGNTFIFGTKETNDYTRGPVIVPEEAWNIDTKIDDGLPQLGKIMGLSSLSAANDNTACSNRATSDYALPNTAQACALVFTE